MLESLEVENYRSFADPARLELRPLTILLGRNSAGKSSITRLFPLLKRSVSRETSAPVLWAAPGFLDFGGIKNVLNRSATRKDLRLTFDLGEQDFRYVGYGQLAYVFHSSREIEPMPATLKFTVFLGDDGAGKTRFSGVRFDIDKDTIEVRFSDDSISKVTINGKRFTASDFYKQSVVISNKFFPGLYFVGADGKNPKSMPEVHEALEQLAPQFVPRFERPSANALLPSLSGLQMAADGGSHRADPPFIPRNHLRQHLSRLGGKQPSAADTNQLYNILLFAHVSSLLQFTSTLLTPTLQNVSYLGPIRATGIRFYREQELSVDQIDEQGENLATYIQSLPRRELDRFNSMLLDLFGVRVRSQSYTGHISLEVASGSQGAYDNLADVGFGFSQLLPLVAQIHSTTRGRAGILGVRAGQEVLAVEQPELHLHPAFQARLADLFVMAVARQEGVARRQAILETHSESFVARLAELVALGTIRPDQIAIHFVEKDDESGTSTIRIGEFSDDGVIKDWPLGFFSARA